MMLKLGIRRTSSTLDLLILTLFRSIWFLRSFCSSSWFTFTIWESFAISIEIHSFHYWCMSIWISVEMLYWWFGKAWSKVDNWSWSLIMEGRKRTPYWWFHYVMSLGWWSASMNCSGRKVEIFFISSYVLKDSGPSIELDSHLFVGISECFKFTWKGSILSTKYSDVALHCGHLALQVWVVLKEVGIGSLQLLNFGVHAMECGIKSVGSCCEIIDVTLESLVTNTGLMYLSLKVCVFIYLSIDKTLNCSNLSLGGSNIRS